MNWIIKSEYKQNVNQKSFPGQWFHGSLTNQGKDYGLKLFADCVDRERGYGVESLVCFSKIFE